ncbi:MAG: hypothetical protein P4L36_07505, partial [Holophaga sp.]|nr:hypothetical protein [Holophaga sp.]
MRLHRCLAILLALAGAAWAQAAEHGIVAASAGGEVWNALGWGNLLTGELEPSREAGWTLRADWGSLRLGARPGLARGSATLFVPSDAIQVLTPGLPADNVLEAGVVEELIPLGG